MPDELQRTVRGVQNRLNAVGVRRVRSERRTNVLRALNGADYLSLVALFFAWVSALQFLQGEPNWGIVVMFGAFLFDKLDGYYARRKGVSSAFGRQVDSFIDIFAYLVTGALLFHFTLAPNLAVSAVVGFAVVAFGGLRLIRHNEEGFGDDEGTSYYHGTTVVHTNVVVLANYFLVSFLGFWNGWIAAVTILAVCPLMISNYKAYKNDRSHLFVGIGALTMTALCLVLEFGL